MVVRLIGMEKQTGVCSVRIGETWHHCFAKCILAVVVLEAKEAYGMDQICRGLKARIEGGKHVMQMLCKNH